MRSVTRSLPDRCRYTHLYITIMHPATHTLLKARERWRQFVNDNINLVDNGITIPLPQVDAMFELGSVGLCI